MSTASLAAVQVLPTQQNGQTILALRDPLQLAGQTMAIPPQALGMLQHFRGEKTISEIGDALKAPREGARTGSDWIVSGCLRAHGRSIGRCQIKQLREAGHFPPRSTQGLAILRCPSSDPWLVRRDRRPRTHRRAGGGAGPKPVLQPSLGGFAELGTLSAADLPRTEWWCWDQPTPPSGKGSAHNWASRPPSGFVLWTKSCSNCSKKKLAIRTTTTIGSLCRTRLGVPTSWIQECARNIPVTAAILPDRLLAQDPEDGVGPRIRHRHG